MTIDESDLSDLFSKIAPLPLKELARSPALAKQPEGISRLQVMIKSKPYLKVANPFTATCMADVFFSPKVFSLFFSPFKKKTNKKKTKNYKTNKQKQMQLYIYFD